MVPKVDALLVLDEGVVLKGGTTLLVAAAAAATAAVAFVSDEAVGPGPLDVAVFLSFSLRCVTRYVCSTCKAC